MKKEKKQSAFAELMSYAGKYKILTYFSIVFSVISGIMAVAYSRGYMAFNFCALACSHLSAFRVAKNMKKSLLYHISKLPIGFSDEIGSGKIRRIVSDETGNTETFLAHNLPDIVQAITVPIVLIVMFFIHDIRFGIASLILF
ncbi:ABC transporter transmembrane domain-containing protein [Lachnobacterium bovis]|uniref:ABC transporter transmembrane domain-containing protein n=1 Tax=Lachnobacterium bovis TaxID=140626 RepID=UPI0003B58CA1|nr:ABC transporter transmembrane domain-containing protein [Lachnobacterium bovis]